eukprot:jgi/Psemu1/30335/gm1.30335_g
MENTTPQSAYKRKVLKPRFLLESTEYCARSNELNHGNGNDKRNSFLYHFETGFDALCSKNGHLVLTILNGQCNKIDEVRARLNSQKGHFNEEGGLEIWEQCLKYVMEELFPFYEEGNTGGVDHVWAMGIIMAYVLCGYPALKGTEDIQCYNNVERLELNGRTFPPKQWCKLTPEAREHIKECIHFNPGNHPCLTSLWFNEWRTMTEEAIIEKYRRRYIEEADDIKEQNKETEKNKIEDNWNSFMKKATKQSKREKLKLKQLANKEKMEKEDGNKRNIVHWLQLYEKRWNSPEDLEEYNNYPVPCGAWGRVKYCPIIFKMIEVVIAERKTCKVFDQNDVYYALLVMEPEAALSENNKILIDASLHVKQARRYCSVVDYCQNAQLPNLGATQPGDTYYMAPLTVAILGIVDCSLEGGSLDAFAYHKGIVGGELTVLMDNCGDQNQNNHVLHLANLLVEAGYFKKANFMFYVVGHTKNCADPWFNMMKRDYQNQNLYTFEQLRKALGTNERITIHSVKDGDFKHYKWLEDLFYKDLKTGTIQPGHIFTVESDAPTTIKILQDCLGMADVSVQDLQKHVTVDCDRRLQEAARDFVLLDPVAPTGIKEIKQIELYTKWRKLVTAEFVDIICPYPGDEVMKKFKEERNRKARERTQQKRDTSSHPTTKQKAQ